MLPCSLNKFVEMKYCGRIILFSELLEEIPPDDVLLELFPNPITPKSQLVNHRGLEVLKLRLDGLKQPDIAGKLNLTQGQVAYSSKMAINGLRLCVPAYVEVDIPALRKILNMNQAPLTEYTKLSELLRDMPSDEKLEQLFSERGNIAGTGVKRPPTNADLQMLQMRQQAHSLSDIGKHFDMEATDVRQHIKRTLIRIRRDLNIELDVPELYKSKGPKIKPSTLMPLSEGKNLHDILERERGMWTLNKKDQKPVFIPLTNEEIEIIIEALDYFESRHKAKISPCPESDQIGRFPFKAKDIADLYEKVQISIGIEQLHRLAPDCEKEE